jgi:hypothetical protein
VVFFGVYHQNNLCVVIPVLYFFTFYSCHGKTCEPTQRITNCSQCSHVFWCGSHSAPSGSRKSRLNGFELDTIGCRKVPPCLFLHSAVCPLLFHTSGRSDHFLTNVKILIVRKCYMAS